MTYTATDWSIDRATKNIRYIGDDHDGTLPSYATVIESHRAWQALADDAVASGDDELDITNINPSQRSTDNIITLINGYNIDDNASEHLYDGSIIQDGGDTIYDGIVNFGVSTVQIQIMQDGQVLADDWWNYASGGLNADSTSGISHRFMLPVRKNGVDIDQRKLIGVARTFGNTYPEFSINATARGNNVLALSDSTDLNNATAIATIAGYTGVTNTEGLRAIDVDNNGTDEEYYSEWNTNQPTRSINDFYERTKWLSKDPVTEDSNTDSGTNFIVDNVTITGAAQSFANGANAVSVTKVTVNLKKVLVPTGNITASIYTHSGTYGTSSIPLALTGSASDGYDSSLLTTTEYREITFNFPSPVALTASTNYCLVIEHATGDASNYVEIEGLASSGTHGGNRSHNTAGWTAVAADDLAFTIYTTPLLNGLPGVLFRGITHSFAYDGEIGGISVSTNDKLVWGTALVYSGLTGTPVVGEAVHEDTATPVWKARIIAVDLTNLTLIVDADTDTITTAETFTCQTSGATATVNGTPTAVSGGGMLHILANDTADNLLYPQVLRGTAPSDNDILYYGGTDLSSADTTDYLLVFGSITSRTISTPFVGASTGSALIGSYGLGVEASDLASTDKVFDLTNTQITPPNNVTNTFGGLVSGEDRVLVVPWDGTSTDVNGDPAINKNQMLLSTALTTDNITSVVVKIGDEATIPSDTPSTGYVRVTDDNGFERRLHYTTWDDATDTFTIDTTDGNEDFVAVNASVDNYVYIAYIDELSSGTTATFTSVKGVGSRDLVALTRDGGSTPTKQFISSWSLTTSNQTLTTIRTSDS